MRIKTGYVVCQDNGDWTSPICVHPALSEATVWLLMFWTADGVVSDKYRPENYCVERWEDGAFIGMRWRIERDGRAVDA